MRAVVVGAAGDAVGAGGRAVGVDGGEGGLGEQREAEHTGQDAREEGAPDSRRPAGDRVDFGHDSLSRNRVSGRLREGELAGNDEGGAAPRRDSSPSVTGGPYFEVSVSVIVEL
ncbi:hypothetical protein GCM10023068_12190 [Leifsonia shinshuensis]